jgi:hypothetical protein
VKPKREDKKVISIVLSMFILAWVLIRGSGCKVEYTRGTIKTKKGTVTKASIEYTDPSAAFRSSCSMAERKAK